MDWRWLNPFNWLLAPYYLLRGLLIARDMNRCTECDLGERFDHVPFEDLCDYHQERYKAAFGEEIVEKWWGGD